MSTKSLSGPIAGLRPKPRTALTFLLALLLCVASVGVASAGKWKGKTVEQDGVTRVLNPNKGMEKPKTIKLDELWRLGGDSEDEDEFFGIISRVLVGDEGNVYLLDSQLSEIKIYDKDGGYLNTIGREGEGPGEFRGAAGMFFLPGGNIGVLQTAPGKIVILSTDGDPIGDHPLPSAEGAAGGFILLVGGLSNGTELNLVIGVNSFDEGKFTQTRSLINLSPEGETNTTYVTGDRTMDFSNALIDEKIWDGFENRWSMSNDGKVYAAETWGEYAVTRWAADGTKEMIIERELEHRKRSQEEIDLLHNIYSAFTRQLPNAKIEISDLDQDVFRVYCRDDGSLWVHNSFGANDVDDGTIGIFDVFNKDGRFIREVTLKGDGHLRRDGYFFVKDRLYVVTGLLDAVMAAQGGGEDTEEIEEAEPMAVICYKLDLKV